ncbi:hypothetical protein [Clostridium sp.]|uniref:hypothetical protein n=1 Tax=Clostridium sp. TaxID=1506 RepID=UPI0025BFDF9B|nr:hypothetical protein [Clostridium sp.]MCI1715815.1 hypothetical protein [Clostridium sp.]MCI1799980.1 hypothetical protein [Clostridium sp.]MCI1813894.1 hypothetical protein [Clostridium sp.]MCI2201553.1 hypothetical protein [Clostridium sp.]
MRRKPSIFSKDYEKKMKQRRIKIFIISAACIVLIILIGVYLTGALKDVLNDVGKKAQNPVVQNQKITKTPAKPQTSENKTEKTQYTVQLSSGKSVNLIYENKNNSKAFKDITPKDANVVYSISPSGKNVVLFDGKIQSMLLFDINGKKQDITNPQYISSTGSVVSKDGQLSSDPNYIWCSSPKFIDDNNIAYISQLPWIGKTSKYIWIENIKDKSHLMVQSVEGEDIKFGDSTDKGLTVVVDGKTMYLTASGGISQ